MTSSPFRFIYVLGLFFCVVMLLGLLSEPQPDQFAVGGSILAGAAFGVGLFYRRKPKIVMPGRGPTHQLDYPPSPFLGRKAELGRAAEIIREGRLVAICGKDGAGKTALALKLAYDRLPQYPDGQFHLDLGGSGSEGLSVPDAQAGLLHNIDPAGRLPDDPQQLAALYQSAFQGKHVVLLLDNAASGEQVQALLLPPGNLVLVTALDVLDLPDLLDLRPIFLEGLSAWDSRRLFHKWANSPGILSWFDRSTNNLIRACNGLPGVLNLFARQFNHRSAATRRAFPAFFGHSAWLCGA